MEIFLQLILAAFLGGLLGLEREHKGKEAGLRTYSLVALGSAFFTLIAFEASHIPISSSGISFDPARIIGQIVLGVGFIGAGIIIHREFHIRGLTTAAGLWVAAAIGAAVGIKLYIPAAFVTFLAIGVLAGLRSIEEKFFEGREDKEHHE